MNEIWKDIEGYNGRYQISNNGRLRSMYANRCLNQKIVTIKRVRIMSATDNGSGYLRVSLINNNKRKNHYIHRLVAQAFISNPLNKKEVNHIDYDKQNNNIDNLEWMTPTENSRHSVCNKPKFMGKDKNSNCGKKYITYRSLSGKYEVTIKHRYYGVYNTLSEALNKRDSVLSNEVF